MEDYFNYVAYNENEVFLKKYLNLIKEAKNDDDIKKIIVELYKNAFENGRIDQYNEMRGL